jgi:hypothetical protein
MLSLQGVRGKCQRWLLFQHTRKPVVSQHWRGAWAGAPGFRFPSATRQVPLLAAVALPDATVLFVAFNSVTVTCNWHTSISIPSSECHRHLRINFWQCVTCPDAEMCAVPTNVMVKCW